MIYTFIPNVKSLRTFLMHVQIETRCKCLTTFCNRLFPSVLKTADDLMQIVIVSQSPSDLFYFVLAFGVSFASASEIQLLGLAFCCGYSASTIPYFPHVPRSYLFYIFLKIVTIFNLIWLFSQLENLAKKSIPSGLRGLNSEAKDLECGTVVTHEGSSGSADQRGSLHCLIQ